MLQQLQPPFDLHLSSVSELGLEIFHVGRCAIVHFYQPTKSPLLKSVLSDSWQVGKRSSWRG